MKRKILLTVIAVVTLGSSMTAYAQPKTMSDGTVFDAEYYANTYPDVNAAFGNDEAALYNHYVQYGKAEGRKACDNSTTVNTPINKDEFDPVFYANTYPDVKAVFGNDEAALYNHYVQYGKAEGRLPKAGGTAAAAQKNVTLVSSVDFGWQGYIIDTYSDGSKICRTTKLNTTVEDKYLILRTDYNDGLLDKDGNGIDDRDPYNSCGYTDLNYNCIADGILAFGKYPEANQHKYDMCPHGVVNGYTMCDAKECVEYRAWVRTLRAY